MIDHVDTKRHVSALGEKAWWVLTWILIGGTVSNQWLASMTTYTDKTLAGLLTRLAEMQYVVRTAQGWRIAEGRQGVLGDVLAGALAGVSPQVIHSPVDNFLGQPANLHSEESAAGNGGVGNSDSVVGSMYLQESLIGLPTTTTGVGNSDSDPAAPLYTDREIQATAQLIPIRLERGVEAVTRALQHPNRPSLRDVQALIYRWANYLATPAARGVRWPGGVIAARVECLAEPPGLEAGAGAGDYAGYDAFLSNLPTPESE